MADKLKRNPGVAAVLSFLFSGLGQIYNGEIKKGLWIMAFSALAMTLVLVGAIMLGYYFFGKVFFDSQLITGLVLLLAGVLLIAFFGIYSLFDAAKEK